MYYSSTTKQSQFDIVLIIYHTYAPIKFRKKAEIYAVPIQLDFTLQTDVHC